APPGYVGHEDGGALTEAVRRRPYQVVLFDEIEKAHPDIFNILLQVLDEGRLTDGKGRQVDFRNAMILLTSNIGAEHLLALDEKAPADDARDAIMTEVAELFRPEFLNRLDEILLFRRLSRDDMAHIVKIQLDQLQARLCERSLTVCLSAEATEWLANKGYDVQFGARPLQRVIKTKLQNPLAEALLQGDFAEGDVIIVGLDKVADKLVFDGDRALATAS
ncbi:MAG: AAA family ATPase, partial [Pseudomonadota bacterium]|nr:AAA family ATPase [Pseudomonadota bacterium]